MGYGVMSSRSYAQTARKLGSNLKALTLIRVVSCLAIDEALRLAVHSYQDILLNVQRNISHN